LLISDLFAGTDIAAALHDLATKTLDFVGSHAAKIIVECIAGFELLTVDQQSVWARQWIAGGLIEISKQCMSPVVQCRRAVLVLPMEARDEGVNKCRDCGVLADDNETGWHRDALLLP